MSEQTTPLQVQQFHEYHPSGFERDFPVDFVLNNEASMHPEKQQVHLYAGIGEENLAAVRAMEVFDRLHLPAAAVVLPFHHLEPTKANLKRVAVEVPTAFASYQNQMAGRDEDSPTDLFGSSQGGGAVIVAASEAPERFGAIGAKAPIGLNRKGLGVTSNVPAEHELRTGRHQIYLRLGVENGLKGDQMPIHFKEPVVDVGNILGQYEIWKRIIKDAAANRLVTKLNTALEFDLSNAIASLRQDHPMNIWVGDKDRLIRFTEVMKSLGRVGCEDLVTLLPGASHSAVMSRAGAKQLEAVGEWYKQVHDKEPVGKV